MVERAGTYIVIEGTDGTGKTTVAKRLAKDLAETGIDVLLPVIEEPEDFSKPITSVIRETIKNKGLPRRPETNLGLFSAARAESWLGTIKPALDADKWVVTSRNYYSTLVYQGYGEGIEHQRIINVTREILGEGSERYLNPDHALVLLMEDEEERVRRINNRGPLEVPDTFESKGEDFQQRLLGGYALLAQDYNLPTVDASGSPDEVYNSVLAHLRKQITNFPI